MIKYCFLFMLCAGCISSNSLAQVVKAINYNFESPELLIELPNELKEISGLSLSPSKDKLIAVQDEHGLFFELDIKTGEVLTQHTFWKEGDYEGIEAVGNDIWVVKSTGTLYRIVNPGARNQEVTKFNGFLSVDNDVEGLAYDAKNHRLLLCCKAVFEDNRERRSIFAFELKTLEFVRKPIIDISKGQLQAFLNNSKLIKRHDKAVAFVNDLDGFKLGPSGIAIHPLSADIYLLSSSGRLLLVLDEHGDIQHLRRLGKKSYLQPEGITFAADGTMYISSEGRKDKPACIQRIAYRPGFSDM